MSYVTRTIVLAFSGFVLIALCLTADAQCAPLLSGLGIPAAGGNFGNGITDTWYSTTGVGGAATTDSFVNSFAGQTAAQGFGGPFGGFGGWGCGGFGGCGTPFASFGPFTTGVGGNWGAQNSASTGVARAQTFGLQPTGLVFGVPVAGPGGLIYT